MLVHIISGTYGYRSKLPNGEPSPYTIAVTRADLPIDVEEEEARRLVELGVAEYVQNGPVATAGKADEPKTPNGNIPAEENATEAPETAGNDEDDLEAKTYAELKAYAQEIGLDNIGKYRSKAALIEALEAFRQDEPPDLTVQDVVDK